MARKSSVLEFRRPKPRKSVTPGPVRTNKLKFSRRGQRGSIRGAAFALGLACVPAFLLISAMPPPHA